MSVFKGEKGNLKISELSGVRKVIREGGLSLKNLSTEDVRQELQKTILKKKGLNSHAGVDTFAI